MPLDEWHRFDTLRETPSGNRGKNGQRSSSQKIDDRHAAPAPIASEDRGGLGSDRHDHERDWKVNEQRVQTAEK